MKNKFIVFEGIDASGKSVVGKLVANALFSDYIESPTEEFQLARAYLEKSSLPISRFLFYIATNIDLSQKIKRKLKENHIVCSRYYYSTLVGYSGSLSMSTESLLESVSLSHSDFYQPDLTIFLYVNLIEQKNRLNKRNKGIDCGSDARCLQDTNYSRVILEEYVSVAKNKNWFILDTSNMSIKEVVEECLLEIKSII